MPEGTALQLALDRSAAIHPERVAVEEAGGREIGYRELAQLSDRLRDRLSFLGVQPGGRVGFVLRKSIDSVAALFGILKCGAAYVPIDPGSPAERNAYILHDCSVSAVIIEEAFAAKLGSELGKLGECPPFLVLSGVGGGVHLRERLDAELGREPARLAELMGEKRISIWYSAPSILSLLAEYGRLER